jgi:hypothetical protein
MKKSSIAFRTIAVIIALALIMPLASCGEEEATTTVPQTGTSTPTQTTVARTGQTATISEASGDVQMLEAGAEDWYAASSGMKLYTGDSLKTGDDGYALVVFHEGSVMELETNTEIQIVELDTSSSGSTTVRIKQIVGNAMNRVEQLLDSASTYEVEMPAGTAVVRGTNFWTKVFEGIGLSCLATLCQDDDVDCKPIPNGQDGDHCVRLYGTGQYSNTFVDVCQKMEACCWPGQPPAGPFHRDPNDDPANWLEPGGSGYSYDIDCPDQPYDLYDFPDSYDEFY